MEVKTLLVTAPCCMTFGDDVMASHLFLTMEKKFRKFGIFFMVTNNYRLYPAVSKGFSSEFEENNCCGFEVQT
jgi:hypothetical protein